MSRTPLAIRTQLGQTAADAGVGNYATDSPIIDGTIRGIDFLGRKTLNALMLPGYSPLKASLAGLGVGAGYDLLKRRLLNTQEENEEEGIGQRAARYLIPAAGLGLLGGYTGSAFSDYYKFSPHFKA